VQTLASEGGGRGTLAPLDFEIWHFSIKFLTKKGCFLSFEWEKMKYHHFWPPWKNPFDIHDYNINITLKQIHVFSLPHALQFSHNQGCGVGVVRSRRYLGGVGVGFLTTLGVGIGFFVPLRHRMFKWIIFYITLLKWEFLLKWYNLCWNFCWNRDFLLCTTISIDFNSQISFPLC